MAGGGLGRTAWTSATTGVSKGSIFFLHGTCDSGPGLKNWVGKILQRRFQFKDYRIIYPSSPLRPYHLMNDSDAAVWYNRLDPGPAMPEDLLSINQVGAQLESMIREEQGSMGTRNVILGGFSMGGSMALHLGYRFNRSVAGVFALSSFLPPDSSVFTELSQFVKDNPQTEPEDCGRKITEENGSLLDKEQRKPGVPSEGRKLPKLFMSLGSKDPLVRPIWTQNTFDQLRTYGVEGHLYTFPQQTHEILGPQLNILHNWIEETLSDSPKPKITQTKPFHVNDEGTLPVPLRYWPNDNNKQ